MEKNQKEKLWQTEKLSDENGILWKNLFADDLVRHGIGFNKIENSIIL